MTKIKLRLVSAAVSVLILSSVFAGCGKTAETKQAQSGQNAQATQAAPKEEKPVTIEWLAYQTTAQPDSNSEIVKTVEKKYNAKFNFWMIDEQKWDDTLNVKLAAGEVPDVMRLKTKTNLDKYVKQGILGELPVDKVKKVAPQYAAYIDKHDAEKMLWYQTMYNGKNYGFSFVGLNGTYPLSLLWRQDWLKNVGIEKVPESLAEFEDAMYKFRNNDPDKNGKKDTYGFSNMAMQAVFGAFGCPPMGDFRGNPVPGLNWVKKDGKLAYAVTQPEMKEALAVLQKWYKDGVIDPEFITGENKGGYWAYSHAFFNSKVGVTGGGMFYHYKPSLFEGDKPGNFIQEMQKTVPNMEYGKTAVIGKGPAGPKGKSGLVAWGYAGEAMVVSVNCVKDERKTNTVLKMLNDFIADENYNMFARYGQKDADYKFAADNVTVSIITNDAVEMRKKGIQVFSFLSDNIEFQKKSNKQYYEFADKVKGTGYYPPFTPATEAGSKHKSNLEKLAIETYIRIITGEKSVDSFDEFVKTFKANGGDEVEKAANEALAGIAGGK